MVPVDASRIKLLGHVRPNAGGLLWLVVLAVPGRPFTECEIYGQVARDPTGWYTRLRATGEQDRDPDPAGPTIYRFAFRHTEPPVRIGGLALWTARNSNLWQLEQKPVASLRVEDYRIIFDDPHLWVGETRR